MTDSEQNADLVRRFCEAWSRRDPQELAGYFADDAIYHNIPMKPVAGRRAIAGFITQFLAGARSAEFEIGHLAVAGETVFTERVDRFQLAERTVELPVAGVFELRDGKIGAWRDYFDLETWARQTRG